MIQLGRKYLFGAVQVQIIWHRKMFLNYCTPLPSMKRCIATVRLLQGPIPFVREKMKVLVNVQYE